MMDEWCNVKTLLDMLCNQEYKNFTLYVCVNQPDEWWNDGDEQHFSVCKNNQQTLEYLQSFESMTIVCIDKCTKGNGWAGKQKGVGWARKLLFERIMDQTDENELIVSLDADTSFDNDYLLQVLDSMNANPNIGALAVPYYHPLSGIEDVDRCMLRYECYMRYYLINLLDIDNPYAFSALGSAMVFPSWAYKRVGGITPLQGGEDFYLMQKFAKVTSIVLDSKAIVYPQGRISHRVPFGTGPAILAGLDQQTSKYPFYSLEGFDAVKETYAMLSKLYDADMETPMSGFLRDQLKTDDLWGPLRKNYNNRQKFVRAAQERIDGLRILQYLKRFPSSEMNFNVLLKRHGVRYLDNFSFYNSPIEDINNIRNNLFEVEQHLRSLHK